MIKALALAGNGVRTLVLVMAVDQCIVLADTNTRWDDTGTSAGWQTGPWLILVLEN